MKIKNVFIYGSNIFVAILLLLLLRMVMQFAEMDQNVGKRVAAFRESSQHIARISQYLTLQVAAIKGNEQFPVTTRVRFFEYGELIDVELQHLLSGNESDDLRGIVSRTREELGLLIELGAHVLDLNSQEEERRAELVEDVEESFISINENLFLMLNSLISKVEAEKNIYRGHLSEMFVLLAVFTVVVIIVGFWFALFARERVVKPLDELVKASERISKGEFSPLESVPAAREISSLLQAFNNMVEHLGQNQRDILGKNRQLREMSDEITQLNATLEDKVDERSRELLETQEYLRQIIYGAPVSIGIFNSSGILIDCNVRFMELSGQKSRKELMGSPVESTMPSLGEKFNSLLRGSLEQGPLRSSPVRINTKWYIHNFCPVTDSKGNADEVMVFSEDVTEIIHSREQVRRKNAELEEFVYTVSHDLKSPLFSLRGYLNILTQGEQELSEGSGKHRIITKLEKSIAEVEDRVTDLLELSRLGAGRNELAAVDVKDTINMAVLALRMQFGNPRYRLDIGELPVVVADRKLMDTLFDNLISNSFKYSHPGRELVISVECQKRGSKYWFTYEDNGLGISAEDLPNIFKIFYRGSGSRAEGTGVGLTLVKKAVESMGGEISVESEEGTFTRLVFSIPAISKEDINQE